MSVRKRHWNNGRGEAKSAWVVDYVDGKGVRRLKTLHTKKAADAFAASTAVAVAEGTHVADRAMVTVAAAGTLWIASRGGGAGEVNGRGI